VDKRHTLTYITKLVRKYKPEFIRDASEIDAYLKKGNDISCVTLCEDEIQLN
jgi:hypothetical protein